MSDVYVKLVTAVELENAVKVCGAIERPNAFVRRIELTVIEFEDLCRQSVELVLVMNVEQKWSNVDKSSGVVNGDRMSEVVNALILATECSMSTAKSKVGKILTLRDSRKRLAMPWKASHQLCWPKPWSH